MELIERLQLINSLDLNETILKNYINDKDYEYNIEKLFDMLNLTGINRKIAYRAVKDMTKNEIKIMLASCLLNNSMQAPRRERLVVTGLDDRLSKTKNIDDTYQTIIDLITSVKERITIVGYEFNDNNIELINRISNKLQNDKVIFNLITHGLLNKINDGNHDSIKKWVSSNTKFSCWSFESSNKYELMHIKCVIADSNSVYVGSANFSIGGSTRNIEMGIIIRDEIIIRDINEIIKHLMNGEIVNMKKIDYHFLKTNGYI